MTCWQRVSNTKGELWERISIGAAINFAILSAATIPMRLVRVLRNQREIVTTITISVLDMITHELQHLYFSTLAKSQRGLPE